MTHELTPNEGQPPDRQDELARLAEQANEAHRQVGDSLQQAVAKALEAGRALLLAKEICEEKKFTAWLKAKFDGGVSTGRRYMRFVAKWNELGGDHSRASGLSQRQISKLLKGLPCSDGRANPHTVRQLSAPRDGASSPGNSPIESTETSASDPLEKVGRLLDQAVAELRILGGASSGEGEYARHLLQPLEYIRLGIPDRRWFWELTETIEA